MGPPNSGASAGWSCANSPAALDHEAGPGGGRTPDDVLLLRARAEAPAGAVLGGSRGLTFRRPLSRTGRPPPPAPPPGAGAWTTAQAPAGWSRRRPGEWLAADSGRCGAPPRGPASPAALRAACSDELPGPPGSGPEAGRGEPPATLEGLRLLADVSHPLTRPTRRRATRLRPGRFRNAIRGGRRSAALRGRDPFLLGPSPSFLYGPRRPHPEPVRSPSPALGPPGGTEVTIAVPFEAGDAGSGARRRADRGSLRGGRPRPDSRRPAKPDPGPKPPSPHLLYALGPAGFGLPRRPRHRAGPKA